MFQKNESDNFVKINVLGITMTFILKGYAR